MRARRLPHGEEQGAIMSLSVVKIIFAGLVVLTASIGARAGSLQVEPVLIDLTAPGAASTITLRNEGATPIKRADPGLSLVAGRRQGKS
jgi:hypothetical protein